MRIGAAEVGQGTHLALRQIAAETLGLPLAKVEMVTDDSAETPNAGSASASRMTLMGGQAVHRACSGRARAVERDRGVRRQRDGPVPSHRRRRRSTPRPARAARTTATATRRRPSRSRSTRSPARCRCSRSSACMTWAARSTASRSRGRSRDVWRRRSAMRCWRTCKRATGAS